jgi:hypothetical protein
LVDAAKIASAPSVTPGPLNVHSTELLAGTGDCGLAGLNVFAVFPRVGFGWPA